MTMPQTQLSLLLGCWLVVAVICSIALGQNFLAELINPVLSVFTR
jgi:hypothetical protein